MPQYVIQRSLSDPGPGPLTDAERGLVPRVRSYVTERKIADILRALARARGFPAQVIERVWSVSTTRARQR